MAGLRDTLEIVFRLALATVMGGCVGLERGTRRRPAGLRTFSLVCLGAALAMLINIYIVDISPERTDVGRIPAGVVSGIGFLGVGTIVMTGKNYVKGLTTAACLWVTGVLGLAVGAGYISASVITFLLVLFIMKVLYYVGQFQIEKNRYIQLYVEVEKEKGIMRLTNYLTSRDFQICSIDKQRKENVIIPKHAALEIEVDMKTHQSHRAFLSDLGELDFVHYVEEVK